MRSFVTPRGTSRGARRVMLTFSPGEKVHGWKVLERLPSGSYALQCATEGCEAKAVRTAGELNALAKREMESRGVGGCRACSRRARAVAS